MNLSYVIKGPVITEKSMKLSEHNQYVLRVHDDATKDEIKSAVKKFFGVDASDVKIIHLPKKIRVRSAHGPQTKRKPRKKAIICLPEGTSFDILKFAPVAKAPKKKGDKESSNS